LQNYCVTKARLTIVASVGNTADDGVVVAAGFEAVGFDAVGFDAVGFDAVGFDAVGFDAVGFDAACIKRDGRNACGSPWRRTRP
jgi:uncharacterized protein (DUF362 family)